MQHKVYDKHTGNSNLSDTQFLVHLQYTIPWSARAGKAVLFGGLVLVFLLGSGFLGLPPVRVVLVPLDSGGQAVAKVGVLWFPAQFGAEFGSVYGVAHVVARAVFDMFVVIFVFAHEF